MIEINDEEELHPEEIGNDEQEPNENSNEDSEEIIEDSTQRTRPLSFSLYTYHHSHSYMFIMYFMYISHMLQILFMHFHEDASLKSSYAIITLILTVIFSDMAGLPKAFGIAEEVEHKAPSSSKVHRTRPLRKEGKKPVENFPKRKHII